PDVRDPELFAQRDHQVLFVEVPFADQDVRQVLPRRSLDRQGVLELRLRDQVLLEQYVAQSPLSRLRWHLNRPSSVAQYLFQGLQSAALKPPPASQARSQPGFPVPSPIATPIALAIHEPS